MQALKKNTRYNEAVAILGQLTEAQSAAKLEENAVLALLDTEHPGKKQSALDRAKAMLTGGTPAPRQDLAGLNSRLAEVREKLALLALAIQEQRDIMAGIVGAQSAVVNGERKADHIKAAERIKTALAGLHEAMQAEQSLRAEIGAAGYLCHLEPLERIELSFADSQSTVARFSNDVACYLALHELQAKRVVNVRLLIESTAGLSGDVVTMTGIDAARLVSMGHGEVTTDKPSRVARPVRESYGLTIATAFS